MSFALFLAKNLHLSFSSLDWRWVHTFRCQKRCTLRNSSHSSHCQMAWQGFEAAKQTIEFPAAPSLFSSKKCIKLTKTIGNRKRDCAWGCARGINTTWENLQIEKHKSGRRSFRSLDWYVLFDLQIVSGGVYPPSATSRTISFLFPIVFGINTSLDRKEPSRICIKSKLWYIILKNLPANFAAINRWVICGSHNLCLLVVPPLNQHGEAAYHDSSILPDSDLWWFGFFFCCCLVAALALVRFCKSDI